VAMLHRDLGLAFGRAVAALAEESGHQPLLVGSHGQTVWHHDGQGAEGRASLQLGQGNFVAQAAAALCVADFRQADLALGGEGAPVSALADDWIFASVPRPVAVLNLGGMANLTLLGPRASGELLAWDTGPAGSLLDGLARRLLGEAMDRGGQVASTGRLHRPWVDELLSHTFYNEAPPKSTGRDSFGEAWLDRMLQTPSGSAAQALGVADALASAVAAVAKSVLDGLERHGPKGPKIMLLAGGGAKNLALVRALSARPGTSVQDSRAWGVDPDAREALVFAILGLRSVFGLSSTHPGATGAARGGILGAIFQPPRQF